MQQLMGLAIAMILGREAFAGALRYYLDRFGLGPLWFLTDAVLMAAVGLVILQYVVNKAQNRYFYAILVVAFFLAVGIVSGYAHGNNTNSIVSAVKIAMPLIATLVIYPRFLDLKAFRIVLALIFVLAVLGVFYNRTAEMPWAGYSISQFGVTRAAARQWWIEGESRIAGLGAGSGATANIILLMTLLLARGIARVQAKAAVYAFALAAVYMTTSRTPLIALSCAALVDLWPLRFGRRQNLDRAPLAILFFIATLLPMIYSMVVVFGDDIARYKASSFLDRLNYTWPTMLSLSYDSGWASFLFGQGFGSVGSPAQYSGKYISPISAVDNFMVYMFSVFGVLSLIMALLIFLCFMAIPARERYFAFAACLMMATVSCEGIGGSLLVGFSVAFGLGAFQERRGAPSIATAASLRLGRFA